MADPIVRLNAALKGRYRVERELGEGGMSIDGTREVVIQPPSQWISILRPIPTQAVGPS